MDFAFMYLLVSALWWALAAAYFTVTVVCFGVVGFVLYDLHLMIKDRKKRRDGMH
jgi:hypothetical protein